MAETIVTVFVEGDTEVDFYKKLIAYFREKNGGRLHCKVDVRNSAQSAIKRTSNQTTIKNRLRDM